VRPDGDACALPPALLPVALVFVPDVEAIFPPWAVSLRSMGRSPWGMVVSRSCSWRIYAVKKGALRWP
jgi:NADH:ubiquinone oxidoreductase subunit 3 (subunit A)